MGLRGLEPPTSRLSGVRSNHLSYKPIWFSASGRRFRLPTPFGGDEEDRTPDPLLARQVLSQLSYIPKSHKMGSSGLEPPTSRLSGVRSNQLSYEPIGLRQPSTLPGSCPPSTIDRLGLNRRVRNGNGCVPQAHHHRRCFVCFLFCLKVWSFKTEQWISFTTLRWKMFTKNHSWGTLTKSHS